MTSPALTPGAPRGQPPAAGVARAWWRRFGIAVAGACIIVACFLAGLRGYGPYYLNLSPGTETNGQVSIATNHADYRTTEHLWVTVTNHYTAPIYALAYAPMCIIFPGYGTCGKPPEPLACGGPRIRGPTPPNAVVEIAPGASYHEELVPPVPSGFDPDPLPPGQYRLEFRFTFEPITASDAPPIGTFAVAYSATFHVYRDPDETLPQRAPCL